MRRHRAESKNHSVGELTHLLQLVVHFRGDTQGVSWREEVDPGVGQADEAGKETVAVLRGGDWVTRERCGDKCYTQFDLTGSDTNK